jgi:hypothetical protein
MKSRDSSLKLYCRMNQHRKEVAEEWEKYNRLSARVSEHPRAIISIVTDPYMKGRIHF